jgi:DNA-binding helix-hairpin-helix protein with protein kinase domain
MKKYPPTISHKYLRHYNHHQHLRKAGLALLALGIIFKPTDKNLGTILLDLAAYLALRHTIVDATTTYLMQPPPTLASDFQSLNTILTKHKAQISQRVHDYIMQMQHIDTTLTAAILYILPKLHKPVLEGRPIVTNSNYYTFYASKYLHQILLPLLKIIPTYVTSSTHLITTLNETNFPTTAVLCSFDVPFHGEYACLHA